MLAPEISAKLVAFGQRRRNLLLQRGVCAGVATWLIGMGAVAFLDRVMILDDWVRYVLSAVAWGAAAWVLWRTCAKPMRHGLDPKRVALLIESARPELREELIAAVELADDNAPPQWDSPVFRRLLQEDVARRMSPLEVDSLLPRTLVMKWVKVAGAIVAVAILLLAIPGLHFGLLLLRALAPMANLERVSNVRIAIVEPERGYGNVAANDQVSIVADVSAEEALDVFLDTYRPDGGGGRVKMQRVGKSRYAAEVSMRSAPVKYRVRAADGATKKFTLFPFPRPQVKSFAKTYHFPTYARHADTNIVEATGDLEGLQGSTVKLVIETDQPVSEGQLNFDIAEKTNSSTLEKIGPTKLMATVPMRQSGLYKVRLVGAETGFENKFSPSYEIRVLNDLLPTITLDEPAHDEVIQPDEKIDMTGTARDDVGIDRVDQYVQINEGPWRPMTLATNLQGRDEIIKKEWDMFAMGVRQGDRIATKLVATDWKGNKGESTILRLLVGSTGGADEQERHRVEVERKVHAALDKLAQEAKQVAKSAEQTANDMNQQKVTPKEAMEKLAAESQKTAETAQEAQKEIKEALREIPKGQDAQDLVNLGRMVSQLQHTSYEAAAAQLNRNKTTENQDTAKQQVWKAMEKFRAAAWPAESAERLQEKLLGAKEADISASDLQQLAKEETRIKDSAQKATGDQEKRDQVEQRQELAEHQIAAVQDRLRTLGEEAPAARGWEAKAIAEKIDHTEREAHRMMDKKPDDKHLQDGLDKINQGVENARNEANNLASNLAREAEEARRELARAAKDSSEQIERAHQLVHEAKHDGQPADSPQKQEHVAKADDAIKATAAELRDRAAMEELRNESDAPFQRDLSQAAAALDAIREKSPQTAKQENSNPVMDVAKAMRTLEAGHEVGEIANDLNRTAAAERWDKPEARELAEQAREFRQLANQEREDAQNDLNRAQAPEPAKQDFQNAFNSGEAQQTRQEMDNRANQGQKNAQIAKPLAKMAADTVKARKELQPAMQEARDQIAQYAPALAERMKAMANNEQRMQQKTEELAKQTEPAHEDTANQLARQQDFNEKLDALKNDLRYDANAQDLAKQDGRERARDADDALAMLQKPPEDAEHHLVNATTATQPQPRAEELNQAQQNQQQVANALNQLAQHYEAMDAGKPEDGREAIRAAESPEMKTALDQQYAKAAELAAMENQSPQDAQAALQAELAKNPDMRAALANIARQNLDNAAQNLQRAVAAEKDINQNVNQVAQNQKENKPEAAQASQQLANEARKQENVEGATDQIGKNIEVAGREEAAMGSDTGQAFEQIGQRTEGTANKEMNQAAKQIAGQPQAAQSTPAVQNAQDSAQKRLDELNNALAQMPPAAPDQADNQDAAQAAAQWMARSLDELMHGQEAEKAQALQQAQQAQAHELAMAREENRRFGLVPHEPVGAITVAAAQPLVDANGVPVAGKDWGNLPKQMARDLMNSEHDGVAEEYRGQVDAYFKAVTARAKAKK